MFLFCLYSHLYIKLGPQTIRTWGPYRSSCLQLYQQLKQNRNKQYTLFASGSGFGYLLDVLSFLAYKSPEQNATARPHIDIYYTVSCAQFVECFKEKVDDLVKKVIATKAATVTFQWYVTSGEDNVFPSLYSSALVVTFKTGTRLYKNMFSHNLSPLLMSHIF